MDVTRALADLDEVRTRLAAVQRFRGLSAAAAVASGLAALACGVVQFALAAHPRAGTESADRYVTVWTACLVVALALNYGSVAAWLIRNWSSRSRTELRTAALSILPAVLAGGAFTAALMARGEIGLLPGTWCLCYGLGLLAARGMLPRGASAVAIFFAVVGSALLFAPGTNALTWWVMPLTFGCGQSAIGALIARDEATAEVRA